MTEAQRAAAPPLPNEPEPSKDAAASAIGKYVLKSNPSYFIEIKPDGTVATWLGAKTSVGTYKIKGDRIHLQLPTWSNTLQLRGNTMLGKSQIWEKQTEAPRAEAPRAATTPVTLRLGMTPKQVEAAQGGQPQKVIDLGSKKIYVYPDMKITFVDGKVSDIQ